MNTFKHSSEACRGIIEAEDLEIGLKFDYERSRNRVDEGETQM